MTDLTRLHAHEMAARLRAGDVSSRELTDAHLDAAEAGNRGPERLALDRPRSRARRGRCRRCPDRRGPDRRGSGRWPRCRRSPGIPVALKDLVSVKGGQCTAGSRILEGYRAPYDAHITERLRDAGAVILGKTNMDEFAMGSSTEHSAFGPTANPWDLDRVPGGSSGGSAAAVAAFHAPLSIGTDTGGSIRQPAALCGIVGMKPTYGRVSRYGIVAFASSLDQIGPFARDARDAATLLHAIAGRDDRDSTSSPSRCRTRSCSLPASDDEAAGSLRGKRLGLPRGVLRGRHGARRRGARSARRSPRSRRRRHHRAGQPAAHGLRPRHVLHRRAGRGVGQPGPLRRDPLRPAGSATATSSRTTSRRAATGFGAEVKRRIMLGTYALSAGYYDAYYLKAQKVRTLIKADFDALWAQGFDALVAPTSPTVAFRFGARMADPVSMYLSDACTLPVNMAGLPGISIPCGLSEGLPVGLQFIGAPWSEAELFGLSRGYEAITADADWRAHRTDGPRGHGRGRLTVAPGVRSDLPRSGRTALGTDGRDAQHRSQEVTHACAHHGRRCSHRHDTRRDGLSRPTLERDLGHGRRRDGQAVAGR